MCSFKMGKCPYELNWTISLSFCRVSLDRWHIMNVQLAKGAGLPWGPQVASLGWDLIARQRPAQTAERVEAGDKEIAR